MIATSPSVEPRRLAWIAERRAAVRAAYDAEASTYDRDPYPATVQEDWLRRLLATVPAPGLILDAPCGTGRYFPVIAESGHRVVGIDQSDGMLREAVARHIAVELHHLGLQELPFGNRFDASITVDAMENVAPEDWPLVLANLHRAVRPGGHLYLTVEEIDDATVAGEYEALVARGLPAVLGEVIDGDVAGYHYYPVRQQVIGWIEAEGLEIVDETFSPDDGWGYRHFLIRIPTNHGTRWAASGR